MSFIPKKKRNVLLALIVVYVVLGVVFKLSVMQGFISEAEPTATGDEGDDAYRVQPKVSHERLEAAQLFVDQNLVRFNGHVELYHLVGDTKIENHDATNSEAVTYYLQWKAKEGDKNAFDRALRYIENVMLSDAGYIQWRVESDGTIQGDGVNIASDADLRAINALLIAERRWGDPRYTEMIDTLASGLETVAITDDGYLAPYGGGSVAQPWTAKEVWLSYEDFTVFKELAERGRGPWDVIYTRMKDATLNGQIKVNLYNSMLNEKREYGNSIEGADGYSINSMWMMIRAAESGDPELQASARKALAFYKEKFIIDAQLFALYSSNGDPLSPYDSPWVYALVGRAAVALNDEAFADAMIAKLIEFQVMDPESPLYGALPEGGENDQRVGQFTMQESILTMQDYLRMKQSFE